MRKLLLGSLVALISVLSIPGFGQSQHMQEIKTQSVSLSQLIKGNKENLNLQLSYHPFQGKDEKSGKKASIATKGIMGNISIEWADQKVEHNEFQKQNLKTLQQIAFIQNIEFQEQIIYASKSKLNETMAYAMDKSNASINKALAILQNNTPERTQYIDSVEHYHYYMQRQPSFLEKERHDKHSFVFIRAGLTGLHYGGADGYFSDYGIGASINGGFSFGGFVLELNQSLTRSPKGDNAFALTDFTTSLGIGGVIGSNSYVQVIPTVGVSRFAFSSGQPGDKAGYGLYGAITFVPTSKIIYNYGPGGTKKQRHGLYLRLSAHNAAFKLPPEHADDYQDNVTISVTVGYSFTGKKFSL